MRVSLVAVPVAVLTLAACGGGSSAGTASTQATSAPAASGQPGGPGRGGADFQKIQQCLTAAGISLPTPSGVPSGGTRPSGMPSGSPGARPSGGPGGRPAGGRGGGGMFRSKKVQAALKACGIAVPTGRPTVSPTAS